MSICPCRDDAQPHINRNGACVFCLESVESQKPKKETEIPQPIDHSGTCSSCGGRSFYGYCERCDDLF